MPIYRIVRGLITAPEGTDPSEFIADEIEVISYFQINADSPEEAFRMLKRHLSHLLKASPGDIGEDMVSTSNTLCYPLTGEAYA